MDKDCTRVSKTAKLPLSLAISAALLSACSTNQKTQDAQATSVVYNDTAGDGINATSGAASANAPTYGGVNGAYASPLDAETLAILENLLEARNMSMVEGDRLTVARYGDLWDRIRRGYRIEQPSYNARIEAQKSWFSGRQSYLDRLTARASRYLHHTVTEAERRGIPTELALLPIIESSYDPSATSNAAAAGLWQFIPSTGRIYGLNQTASYDGRRDVIESTRAAYDFLTSLYNQFGSWELALAAYNAGPGRVQRAIDANASQGLATDYWSLRLPTETMNYVPRFLAVAQIVASPSQYNVYLPAIANHSHFRAVPVQYGATLYDVAAITGVSVSELQLLNPALTNLIVDSAGPSRIVIPDSLPTSVDDRLRQLGNQGYGYTAQTSYVAPKNGALPDPISAQTLSSTNTLPTTVASVTSNRTVIQEPPLSPEEVAFIAEQIRSTESFVDPINPSDGAIELDAVQTAQSVLEARGEQKSLRFAADSATNASGAYATQSASDAYNAQNLGENQAYSYSPAYTPHQTYTPRQTAQSNQSPASQNIERYTVKSGDTLSGIADRFGLSVTQLARYNNIPSDTKVMVGQRLWLVAGKVSSSGASANASGQNRLRTTTYTVQSGDTLIGIANRLGTTPEAIAALNNFSSQSRLTASQTIKIPVLSHAQGASSNAQSASQNARSLGATESYTVQSGDTLTALASRYGVSVGELANANNLSSGAHLQVGQKLSVPKQTLTYTVKAGDTLTGVAAKHGVSVAALAQANNLSQTAQLIRGRSIVVPLSNQSGASSNRQTQSQSQNQNARAPREATESYTVQSGDTLTALASRYGVSVGDLASMNNLSRNARLRAGQKLTVPKRTTTYTVRSGDNLTSVARRYGLSAQELAQMNNLKPNDGLQIGQKLTVPNK